jgi:hypothetical protein
VRKRDVVDHALARRALLREVFGGGMFSTTSPSDVCDASPYLVRAAAELGTATDRTCPICRRGTLREVAWVYGDALGPQSGTARTPKQLAAWPSAGPTSPSTRWRSAPTAAGTTWCARGGPGRRDGAGPAGRAHGLPVLIRGRTVTRRRRPVT